MVISLYSFAVTITLRGPLITQNVFVKKMKVDTQCRAFQEKYPTIYLFTEINGKPVCLVCIQQVSVLKEYYIWRH